MSGETSQQALPFPPLPRRAVPFIEGAANEAARSQLSLWRRRLGTPGRPLACILAITGPEGSGKTMLLEREAEEFGVPVRNSGTDFEELLSGDPAAVAVDDAHDFEPLDLFALIEAAAGRRVPLLLAGAGRSVSWAGPKDRPLPDLASRLRSIETVSLAPPDEAMLAQVLDAELRRRGLRLPFAATAEAASHLRREFAAASGFAERVEAVAARGYRSHKALLRDALAEAGRFTL